MKLRLEVFVDVVWLKSESESGHLVAVWKDDVGKGSLVLVGVGSGCCRVWVHQRNRRDLDMSFCCCAAASMQSCRIGLVATYIVMVFWRTLI
jgi:hypothetical protein